MTGFPKPITSSPDCERIEQIAEGYHRLEQVRDAAEAAAYPRRADAILSTGRTVDSLSQMAARQVQQT